MHTETYAFCTARNSKNCFLISQIVDQGQFNLVLPKTIMIIQPGFN